MSNTTHTNNREAARTMPRKKVSGKSIQRLSAYILKYYKFPCIAVLILIIASTLANVAGTLFMKSLIDVYILPFINQQNPDFSALFQALMVMAMIYLFGSLSTWGYNRIMIN